VRIRESCRGLVDYIAFRYGSAAEIGVGHFPDVSLALVGRGVSLFATDIKPFRHNGLRVVVDDVIQPDLSLYASLNLIYSLRPPPELVPYMVRLAEVVSADLIIKPLAPEHPGGKLTANGNSTFFLWSGL
jgi:uncharacterized UPF0146 family protein